jgi:hypothetical protein
MKRFCPIFQIVVMCYGVIAGCVRVNAPSQVPSVEVAYAACGDRSTGDVAALPASMAKAILLARANGIELLPDGEESSKENLMEVTYQVHRTRNGWYVYASGGWLKSGRTMFIGLGWEPGEAVSGAPPSWVSEAAAGHQKAMPARPAQDSPLQARRPADDRCFSCPDRAVSFIRTLPPEVAKAILLARADGIARASGGSGAVVRAPSEQVTYDVCPTEGGWLVYCHGGWMSGLGRTDFVGLDWRVELINNGPPRLDKRNAAATNAGAN